MERLARQGGTEAAERPPDFAGTADGWPAALGVLLGALIQGMGHWPPALDANHYEELFLKPWNGRSSLLFAGGAVALAAALRQRRGPAGGATALLGALLLAGQAWILATGWRLVGGTVPYGVDHPSFLFRLWEFGATFPPALGGYEPWWNAGVEHFAGATSGSHAFGLLNLPLLKCCEPHRFYGFALVFWYVVGFPWIGVCAARAAGLNRAGALCAGILLCGASREALIWGWLYGTSGALASAMMSLPTTALAYRIAVARRGGWGTVLALALSAWLTCLWMPGLFTVAGLGLAWLFHARRWTWRANLRLLAAGALALALLAPWLWVVAFPGQTVLAFVDPPQTPTPDAWRRLARGAATLGLALKTAHPTVVVCGLLGLGMAVSRDLRRWVGPVLRGLALVAGWGFVAWPRGQTSRLAIPLLIVAVLPAAEVCGRCLGARAADARRGRRGGLALAQGALLAALVAGLVAVQRYYDNRGPGRVKLLSSQTVALADWIRNQVAPEARLGFAGPVGYNCGAGYVAYLPILAQREMMADDYYGFPKGMVAGDYPPAPYRRDLASFLAFSGAYGITHWAVVPSARETRRFFRAHPEAFECVRRKADAEVYRLRDAAAPSRFLVGAGRVEARPNRLRVFLDDPAARAVIRYNWRDGLVCRTPGATIAPHAVDEHLRFIAIQPGGHSPVEIGYRPRAAPTPPNFDGYFHH